MPSGPNTLAVQGIAFARQLFLYGLGDGVPILDSAVLAEKAGIHLRTVQRHLPDWTAEREAKLREVPACPLRTVLSEETVREHKRDCAFWRHQSSDLRQEIATLEECKSLTWKLLDKIAENPNIDSNDLAQFFNLLEKHFAATACKQRLIPLLKTSVQMWQHGAGVTAALDALSTQQKEEARGKAKLEAKEALQALEDGRERPATGRVTSTDPVFRQETGEA